MSARRDRPEPERQKPGPFDHAMYAAPWKDGPVEYLPSSPRTGRMVAQSTAEKEHAEMHGAIDSSGLWDFEQEADMRRVAGCRHASAPARYDERQMREYADRHSHEFTDRQLQVYTMFWGGKLSYGQIARHLGVAKERVRECVQQLRAKLPDRPHWSVKGQG